MKTRDSKANKVLRTAALSKNRMPALPVIALYYSEAKDILSGVQDDPEYQEWRKDFTRLFFTAGHFIISEKGKKEDQSMYFSFNAKSRTPHFSVFNHEGILMARFSADIDSDEINHSMDYTNDNMEFAFKLFDRGVFPFSIKSVKDIEEMWRTADNMPITDINPQIAALEAEYKKLKSIPLMKGALDNGELSMTEHAENWLKTKSAPEQKLARQIFKELFANQDRQLELNQDMVRDLDARRSARFLDVMNSFGNTVCDVFCSTMYYFHIRVPKFIDTQEVMTTEGYKKWNPDYNPIKRLQPPSVVRARNGTRSYLEQQRQRRTESWHVRGHLRRYKKTGLEVWITPYVKGTGDGLRLSVYADGVAATDVVTAE